MVVVVHESALQTENPGKTSRGFDLQNAWTARVTAGDGLECEEGVPFFFAAITTSGRRADARYR